MQQAFRTRPSIIGLFLFGWLFILVGAAFRKEKEVCRDCGEIRRYRTKGSNVAAFIVAVLAILVLLGTLSG
ncbi:hypothetical protein OVA24_03140 [Luteolibacter sp. SL250]|uniref:hypothetical protein n=1 Tax=Luteolibacter sp. SL250 TaxID=2995170 RepID=UPI00226DAFE1|nr:hypothetical protein [Luteolibacter sp. SL250]WAC20372.1 hypothetical protein OVA24_03140 [Luteolibacter sp. SL250]